MIKNICFLQIMSLLLKQKAVGSNPRVFEGTFCINATDVPSRQIPASLPYSSCMDRRKFCVAANPTGWLGLNPMPASFQVSAEPTFHKLPPGIRNTYVYTLYCCC
jgi:hypothetical protein